MDKVRGTKDSQETKRLLIVDFIKSKKGTHQQASDLFHVSKSAVDKIWTRYKASGIRGINSKKLGVQVGKKINGKQSAEGRQLIKEKLPDKLKMVYGLWPIEAVQQLILDRYGIDLSRWQVRRYVKC